MIDKAAFSAGVGLLAANFNKTVDPALLRAWYSILSARLTTEQFEQAVKRSLSEDSFWPSAASLLAKIVPETDEARAHAALEHVNRVLSQHGGHLHLPHAVFAEFDAATKAGIRAIDGLAALTNCPVERYATLARKFAKAYTESLHAPPQLAAPEIDAKVTSIVNGTARRLGLSSGRDRAAGGDA